MRSFDTALRMERHCANALRDRSWLEEQPDVKSVSYPGLKSHPQTTTWLAHKCWLGGIVTIT